MWLAPHFMALDVAGASVQLFQKRKGISIYQRQSNAVMDRALRRGRLRLGNAEIFSRDEPACALFRAIRRGDAFFNLPDMDFGTRDAAFVPFFGVPAATLLAPSRMAKALTWWCSRSSPRSCRAARATACASRSRGPTSRATTRSPTRRA